MNFFQQQEHARSKTRWLLFIYALAVAAIVIALDAIFLLVKHLTASEYSQHLSTPVDIKGLIEADANSLWLFSLGIIAFIGLASLYRVVTLRGGGGKVATALGPLGVEPAQYSVVQGDIVDAKVDRLPIGGPIPAQEQSRTVGDQ